MKMFETPEMEIVNIAVEDVITASRETEPEGPVIGDDGLPVG